MLCKIYKIECHNYSNHILKRSVYFVWPLQSWNGFHGVYVTQCYRRNIWEMFFAGLWMQTFTSWFSAKISCVWMFCCISPAGLCSPPGCWGRRKHCHPVAPRGSGSSSYAHLTPGSRRQVLEGSLHGCRQIFWCKKRNNVLIICRSYQFSQWLVLQPTIFVIHWDVIKGIAQFVTSDNYMMNLSNFWQKYVSNFSYLGLTIGKHNKLSAISLSVGKWSFFYVIGR